MVNEAVPEAIPEAVPEAVPMSLRSQWILPRGTGHGGNPLRCGGMQAGV